MSELIGWNSSFDVHIGTLDAQHKRLVGMLNALSDAVNRREAEPVLMLLLDGLLQYTEAHFADEERLMEKHQFPGLAQHRAEHAALTARVLQFRAQFEAGDRDIGAAVLNFLRDWLQGHILNTDKAYSAFLRSRGEQ